MSVFLRLLSDGPETESVGDVVDASLSGDVVDGVRSGDSGVGVAGLLLGGVDVAVAVVVVAELILKKSTSFSSVVEVPTLKSLVPVSPVYTLSLPIHEAS